jgi:hypothetical protein
VSWYGVYIVNGQDVFLDCEEHWLSNLDVSAVSEITLCSYVIKSAGAIPFPSHPVGHLSEITELNVLFHVNPVAAN